MKELQGVARFTFHDGRVDEFKRLSDRCMEIVRTQDSGTLQYEIYFNDDESECIVLERYRDQRALIEHGEHIGEDLMKAVADTGSVHGELLGEMTDEFRASLAGGPVSPFRLYRALSADRSDDDEPSSPARR